MKKPWLSYVYESGSPVEDERCLEVAISAAYDLFRSRVISTAQTRNHLSKGTNDGQQDKTAIFLTLWDNLLWFLEQTLP